MLPAWVVERISAERAARGAKASATPSRPRPAQHGAGGGYVAPVDGDVQMAAGLRAAGETPVEAVDDGELDLSELSARAREHIALTRRLLRGVSRVLRALRSGCWGGTDPAALAPPRGID